MTALAGGTHPENPLEHSEASNGLTLGKPHPTRLGLPDRAWAQQEPESGKSLIHMHFGRLRRPSQAIVSTYLRFFMSCVKSVSAAISFSEPFRGIEYSAVYKDFEHDTQNVGVFNLQHL